MTRVYSTHVESVKKKNGKSFIFSIGMLRKGDKRAKTVNDGRK